MAKFAYHEFMLVLASASPRREEILRAAGIAFFKQVPANVDETPREGEGARDYVIRLALEKAHSIDVSHDMVVLGADTTVVVDSAILEKPASPDDAARMLALLSGRAHHVITGICLKSGSGAVVDSATTRVWFSRLTPHEIRDYVASGEPADKAGAYGIQGLASKYIERIDGCFFNVMGLPISLVYRHLRGMASAVV